jgi:triphosphatase
VLTPPAGGKSPATKAADIAIPLDATAGEAVQIVIDSCLAHLRPNEECWLAIEHPDCLHQVRVSTRRLRALFSLARELVRDDPVAQEIKARLRLILAPLGPARDLDVALARALDEEWSAEDVARLESARAEAYAGVRDVLTSTAWAQVWSDLERWRRSPQWLDHVADRRDAPARAVTDAALDRRYRRVVLAGPALTSMSDHALHRVRIEGKKLRYGCQFFDALYPQAGTVEDEDGGEMTVPLHLADVLADMQDAFGLFNDHAVADDLREELALVSGGDTERPTRLQCVAAWERVAAQPPFWRLT